MNTAKLIIMVGVAGSGKSTRIDKEMNKDASKGIKSVRIGRDFYRMMLKGSQEVDVTTEYLISNMMDDDILNALSKGHNVYLDNTNLNSKYINHYLKLVKHIADVEFIIMETPLEKALEWNSQREWVVPKEVIQKMYNSFIELLKNFDFSKRKRNAHSEIESYTNKWYKYNSLAESLTKAVIFDIDGTLAINCGRSFYENYDKMINDEPNMFVTEMLEFYKKAGYAILIVTGRTQESSKVTKKWLSKNQIHYDGIYFRKDDDHRKDYIVKKEIYENEIMGKYAVKCVIDDRLSVVEGWHKLGLFVLNVNQGNLPF